MIYTIGHSNHDDDYFFSLLDAHGVGRIADVRSHPYSRFGPDLSRQALAARGLAYEFLGRELGTRRTERSAYDGDLARYERIAKTPAFERGIKRVMTMGDVPTALLCAERDPLVCHRAILVARSLADVGAQVMHIHADGSLEGTAELEDRLLASLGMPESDLFRGRAEMLADAYRAQGERIGYRRRPG